MSWLDLFCACLEDLAHPLGFPHLRKASLLTTLLEKELATPFALRAEGGRGHTRFAGTRLADVALSVGITRLSGNGSGKR